MAFFLIPSMVFGLLDQLQIVWQLYLIELKDFDMSGATRGMVLWGMLVFFTVVRLMGFQVRYLAFFLFFSGIDNFGWFWRGILPKNIQLMLEFLKAPFLFLHFSYYILMAFLMILFAILLSLLMILLFTLSVIRNLICGKN